MGQAGTGSGSITASPFISVQGASLHRGGGRAGPAVWWQILDNQHWAVLGPNGSGKSTLMQKLAGRLAVEAGRIVYHFGAEGPTAGGSERPVQIPRRQISYVDFQLQRAFLNREAPFHQARWNSLSRQDAPLVSEYLESGARAARLCEQVDAPADPERLRAERERVVQLLGIEPLLTRRLVQISSGERRKVVLARALLQSPRLLILDNPFAGLDQAFRTRLREIIERLLMDEMRVIVVGTEWDDVPAGVTHVLLLDHDGLVAQGPRDGTESRVAWLRPVGRATAERITQRASPSLTGPEEQGANDGVLVRMEGVSVEYDGVQILNQVDWTVRSRERWALLGPNGAGKSTLLSLLLGDNPQAYANRVTLFGRRRGTGESIWDVKRQIGWAAPELQLLMPAGLPCLAVVCSGFFDSVGLYRRCTPLQGEAAYQWLDRLGLLRIAQRPFGSLSEATQRLVLMARAAVKGPSLLVLDEPCQGLDAEHRDLVLAAVEEIGQSSDCSIIYVSHEPRALPRTITHVLKLDAGRVTACGPLNGHDVRRLAVPAGQASAAACDGRARRGWESWRGE